MNDARRIAVVTLLVLGVGGCSTDLRTRIEAAEVYSPEINRSFTQAQVDLGQQLFFDPELSGNRTVACASCHLPVDHGDDTQILGRSERATGAGARREGGEPLPRNVIAPFNRSFADRLLWDGRVERLGDGSIRAPMPLPEGVETPLEAQALLPLLDRDEMRGLAGDVDVRGDPNELADLPDEDPGAVWTAVMDRLMAIDEYRWRFAEAFPDVAEGEHGIVHAARALALFQMRLWELTDTPFDRYLGSELRPPEETAIDPSTGLGADLFFGDAGCDRCHRGPLLSDDAFHNIGVPPFGPGKVEGRDEGRFLVTGDPEDRFAFRTPPLRNVALTGPYMHNGTSATLTDAIRQHLEPERILEAETITLPDGSVAPVDPTIAAEIRASIDPDARPLRPLSEVEVNALATFLWSLTSDTEQFGLPDAAAEPASVPSGLPVPGSRE